MDDPTYVKEEIEANPVWFAAWIMSEWFNDNAPIGWSRYIGAAESINENVGLGGQPTTPQER